MRRMGEAGPGATAYLGPVLSKRILITGGSKGIGLATAKALARRGHSLILAARGQSALAAAQRSIAEGGGTVQIVTMDVTDDASVVRAIDEALRSGPIDVLVNNAGIGEQVTFLEQSEAAAHREMELNYFGARRTARAVLPSMIDRGQGLIVNVSSLLGTVGTSTMASYCATKAALEAFTHGLRGEVERFGVQTSVFVAPHTQTELGAQCEFRGVRSLPAEYVAKELVRAIERAPRRYAASPVYRFFLRLAAWLPMFMERQLLASVRHRLPEPTRALEPADGRNG